MRRVRSREARYSPGGDCRSHRCRWGRWRDVIVFKVRCCFWTAGCEELGVRAAVVGHIGASAIVRRKAYIFKDEI